MEKVKLGTKDNNMLIYELYTLFVPVKKLSLPVTKKMIGTEIKIYGKIFEGISFTSKDYLKMVKIFIRKKECGRIKENLFSFSGFGIFVGKNHLFQKIFRIFRNFKKIQK